MAAKKDMSPEAVIRRHLGKDIITKTMAKEMLAAVEHVGWMTSWNQKEKCVHYSCCGKTVSDRDRETDYRGLQDAEHRKKARCPFCGREIVYINCNHVRQDDRTEMFHTFYRKSRADSKTLVVIGVWCGVFRYTMAHRDKEWRLLRAQELKPEMVPVVVTILPLGGKPKQYMRVPYPLQERVYRASWIYLGREWANEPSVRPNRMAGLYPQVMQCRVHKDWLPRATAGTAWEPVIRKLQRAAVIPYWDKNLLQTLTAVARHPQIEHMLQGGLVRFAQGAIVGSNSGAVNWRGKTMGAMLRLDSNELARLKRMDPREVNVEGLWLMRKAKENGENPKMEICMQLCEGAAGRSGIREAIKRHGAQYGVMRIARAMHRWKQKLKYYPADLWLDYIRELVQLGEAGDEARIFPADLTEAHAQATERIRIQANKHLDEAVKKRAEELQKKYCFQAAGLWMEPFESTEEIIREGAVLSICIGSYCERYAKGYTTLLKLRRTDKPDEPFHAVEFGRQGILLQCRGFKNRTFPEDEQQVRDFWAAWNKAHKTQQHVHLIINEHKREEARA